MATYYLTILVQALSTRAAFVGRDINEADVWCYLGKHLLNEVVGYLNPKLLLILVISALRVAARDITQRTLSEDLMSLIGYAGGGEEDFLRVAAT